MKSAKLQRKLIGNIGDFYVGMSSIVETFYGRYIALSQLPVSTNSIAYGSNSAGVHIVNVNKEIDSSLQLLMREFNFKHHIVTRRFDNANIEIHLPYNLEVHILC